MKLRNVVTLKAMRFHTHIGVLPHEAEIAQSIEVDVAVYVDRDEEAEGPSGIIDYRWLYDTVASVVATGHIRYLEDLVERVAELVLALPEAARVQVAVRKPHVALSGPLAYAEVSLDRSRDA